MKDREYIEGLYDTYNKLLTERERNYFEDYYYEDNNFQEIADNNGVSKSYTSKYINAIVLKLKEYENALYLYEKLTKLRNIVKYMDDIETKIKIEEIIEKQ